MKSKFAKIIDFTVGSLLIFLCAFALFRYYTTAELAAFSAISITAGLVILFRFRRKRAESAAHLSKASADMFFDFMFLPPDAPAKQLYNGLSAAAEGVKRHGKGVYVGKTAAFCFFDRAASESDIASTIAKAKHFGAEKILLLCKTPPAKIPELDGITVRAVVGDDVYVLFASLKALPEKKYSLKQRRRFSAFFGALSPDKIPRYAMLSFTLGFVAYVGRSIVPFVFSIVCAVLAIAACMLAIGKRIKTTRGA